jgi:alkylhydroperoxidase family enzyme
MRIPSWTPETAPRDPTLVNAVLERRGGKLLDPRAAVKDPAFSDDDRLAMRYALALTETVRVPDALFSEIRQRFSTTEVVELTAAIAT